MLWDDYKRSNIGIDSQQTSPGYSRFEYDVNGHIREVVDAFHSRRMVYATNRQGQVLKREEIGSVEGQSYHRKVQYYYANGVGIGDVGDFGPSRTDYAKNIAENADSYKLNYIGDKGSKANDEQTDLSDSVKQERESRITKASYSADFDANFSALNPQSSSPGHYQVQAGDSLQSIARSLFGDGSLWYLIADANGLDASVKLSQGMELLIPPSVNNIHNSSDTFRPYDASQTLGNVSPELPDPPSSRQCSSLEMIVMIVVIVVVSVYVGPAVGEALGGGLIGTAAGAYVGAYVGSTVGQGLAVMAGYQDKIDWGAAQDSGEQAALLSFLPKFGPTGTASGAQAAEQASLGQSILNNAANQVVSSAVTQLVYEGEFNLQHALQDAALAGATVLAVEGLSNIPGLQSLSYTTAPSTSDSFSISRALQNAGINYVRSATQALLGDALSDDERFDIDKTGIATQAIGNALAQEIIDTSDTLSEARAKQESLRKEALRDYGTIDLYGALGFGGDDTNDRTQLEGVGQNAQNKVKAYQADTQADAALREQYAQLTGSPLTGESILLADSGQIRMDAGSGGYYDLPPAEGNDFVQVISGKTGGNGSNEPKEEEPWAITLADHIGRPARDFFGRAMYEIKEDLGL